MTIFDEQAIEAATRVWTAQFMNHETHQECSKKALAAAEASLFARNRLHYREGLTQLQDGAWITREGHSIRRDQPVAIIRIGPLA